MVVQMYVWGWWGNRRGKEDRNGMVFLLQVQQMAPFALLSLYILLVSTLGNSDLRSSGPLPAFGDNR